MKNLWNKNENSKRITAIALCVCMITVLFPITAAAMEGETVCDVKECLGKECVQEDCLCVCHKTEEPTLSSEPVMVQTEPTETTAPAETRTLEETKTAAATEETTVPAETLTPAETVAETTGETTEPTEETIEETTESTVETTEETVASLTLTWLDQNGEVLATAEKEAGAALAEEDFPALEQVGWYICGEDGLTVTETPVKIGDVPEQALVIRAVDRSVALTVSGEFAVGSDVTLNVVMIGFAGTEYAIQWQNCPIDEEANPVGEWANVEGATGEAYTYTISEDAQNLSWRVVVTLQ